MPNKKYVGKHRAKAKEIQPKKDTSIKAKPKASKSIKKTTKQPATSKKQVATKRAPKAVKPAEKAQSKLQPALQEITLYSKQIAVAVLVLLVVVTSIYGYGAYKETQVENYKMAIYEINVSTDEQITNANNVYASFIDLVLANETTTDFQQAADSAKRALLALETLNPPKKYQTHYQQALNFYNKALETYSKLDKICAYLTKRNKQLSKITKLGGYAEEIKKLRRKAANELIDKTQADLHKAINDMRKLTKNRFYNDRHLSNLIKALTIKTEELDKAAQGYSRYKARKVLEEIEQDFSQNWKKSFYTADRKVLGRYNKEIQALRALYKEVTL